LSGDPRWLGALITGLAGALFGLGLICLLTQRNVIKQVIGLKIMLQGVTLGLIYAGRVIGQQRVAETMVVSALVVETVVIAIAISRSRPLCACRSSQAL